MLLGIHHTAIATPDIDRLSRFYCDVLGMVKLAEGEWTDSPDNDTITGLKGTSARFMLLQAGNHSIEMFQYRAPMGKASDQNRPPCDNGITHFALAVTDIDAEYARLKAAGMRFHAPPPVGDGSAVRAIYGRDPDGNIIELLEIVGETPFGYTPSLARWRKSAAAE